MIVIKKLISRILLDNKDILLEEEKLECLLDNNVLIYYDIGIKNTIHLKEKILKRDGFEFNFELDFKKLMFKYTSKSDNNTILDKFDGSFQYKDNGINIKYNLGDGLKEIIIHLL